MLLIRKLILGETYSCLSSHDRFTVKPRETHMSPSCMFQCYDADPTEVTRLSFVYDGYGDDWMSDHQHLFLYSVCKGPPY